MMTRIAVVAGGGALGALLRFGVAEWFTARGWVRFPWATLFTNVAGCLALGILAGLAIEGNLSRPVKDFAATGLLGAFTTYSTFNLETLQLVQSTGRVRTGIAYMAATLLCGLAAGLLGLAVGRSAA